MVVSVSTVCHQDGVAHWELRLGHCPPPRKRIVLHITSQGEDHNSKFKVPFLLNLYHFYTIVKSKSLKLKHLKSETICSWSNTLSFSGNKNMEGLLSSAYTKATTVSRESVASPDQKLSVSNYADFLLETDIK